MTEKKTIFKDLGITDRAKDVFLYAVEHGPVSALRISKDLKFPRATVYLELENLRIDGLVSITGHKNKRRYLGDLNALRVLVKTKKARYDALSQNIDSFIDAFTVKTREGAFMRAHINYLQGVDGLKSVYLSSLEAKGEIVAYVPSKDIFDHMGQVFMDDFIQERIKRGVRVRNIWDQEYRPFKSLKDDKSVLRDVRIVPNNTPIKSGFFIYDDIVIIITSVAELFSIKIQSRDLATTMRGMFELLWANSLPPKSK